MSRKPDTLTARQRQSQKIMQQKAARKKRERWVRKLQWGCAGVFSLSFAVSCAWLIMSGTLARVTHNALDGFYGATVHAGFAVESLYLEGRNRTPLGEIEKALDVKKGDPILRISVDEVRRRLEAIESVRTAAVERALPGSLYVRIIEREPIALWQHDGKMTLVDDHGVVMSGIDVTPYARLPLIVGEGAPKHVSELMALLGQKPELAKRFIAAIHVGDRRWNIRLSGNGDKSIEVKLPEKDPQAAWLALSDLQANEKLLERDIKVIDLRLQGRLFITLSPEELPSTMVSGKETQI